MNGWRVLQVLSGCEFEVAERAAADGVQPYVPEFIERHRNRYLFGNRDKVREMRRVLFKGYMFMNFSRMYEIVPDFSPQAYARTLATSRVRVQVIDGAPLSDSQIDAVRDMASFVESVSDHTKIEEGSLVEFWHGVLQGVQADVLRVRGLKAIIALTGSRKVLHVRLTDLENVFRATGT